MAIPNKKSITRTPNTKFMSNLARVEKVTSRFMGMTLKELGKMQAGPEKSYITEIIRNALEIGYTNYHTRLSPEKLQDMTYVELACLICNPQVPGPLNAYLNMAYLLTAGKAVSTQVKMFLSIPVRSFFCYLDSISEKPGMLEQLRRITERCAYNDGYTIENFIMDKCEEVNQPWWISIPIDVYEHKMTDAYLDIGDILFDGFQKAFSGKYPVRSICRKYMDDEGGFLAEELELEPDMEGMDPADMDFDEDAFEDILANIDFSDIDSIFPRTCN